METEVQLALTEKPLMSRGPEQTMETEVQLALTEKTLKSRGSDKTEWKQKFYEQGRASKVDLNLPSLSPPHPS